MCFFSTKNKGKSVSQSVSIPLLSHKWGNVFATAAKGQTIKTKLTIAKNKQLYERYEVAWEEIFKGSSLQIFQIEYSTWLN